METTLPLTQVKQQSPPPTAWFVARRSTCRLGGSRTIVRRSSESGEVKQIFLIIAGAAGMAKNRSAVIPLVCESVGEASTPLALDGNRRGNSFPRNRRNLLESMYCCVDVLESVHGANAQPDCTVGLSAHLLARERGAHCSPVLLATSNSASRNVPTSAGSQPSTVTMRTGRRFSKAVGNEE